MSISSNQKGRRARLSWLLVVAAIGVHPSYLMAEAPGASDQSTDGAHATIALESSLRDVRGSRRSLDEFRGAEAVVLGFWGTKCPVANQYVPRLREIYQQFRGRNVEFVLVFSNEHDTIDAIAAHALDFEIPFLVLKDVRQNLADRLGVTRTPTVCVLDHELTVRYRGRIDSRYGVGHRRTNPGRSNLEDALNELLAHQPVSVQQTAADGCLIDRQPTLAKESVNYSDHIGLILRSHCGNCHHSKGQGPFSLLTYDETTPWRDMIREVVSERRMPPWHADERYGPYTNDRSLSAAEIGHVVAWIDAGMPRGAEEPSSSPDQPAAGRWSLDRVDAVIECPDERDIPADGVLEYQYSLVPREMTDRVFDQDRWIQAVELLPSNPSVVHHIQANIYRPGAVMKAGLDNIVDADMIGIIGWAPGRLEFKFPPNAGMRVPKGTQVMFEIHYTPNGRPAKDRPAMAIQFADAPPENEVRTLVPFLFDINIPAGEPNYRLDGVYNFVEPTRLLSINPHMHLRGKAFHCDAVWPDGKRRRLLSVPRYDFNWQTFYWLSDPPQMPVGSRLEFTAWWDNSRFNLNNPDPSKSVNWGIQSQNEMMTCFLFGEVSRASADAAGVPVAVPQADLRSQRLVVRHEVLPWIWKGLGTLIAAAFLVIGSIVLFRRLRHLRLPNPRVKSSE